MILDTRLELIPVSYRRTAFLRSDSAKPNFTKSDEASVKVPPTIS